MFGYLIGVGLFFILSFIVIGGITAFVFRKELIEIREEMKKDKK